MEFNYKSVLFVCYFYKAFCSTSPWWKNTLLKSKSSFLYYMTNLFISVLMVLLYMCFIISCLILFGYKKAIIPTYYTLIKNKIKADFRAICFCCCTLMVLFIMCGKLTVNFMRVLCLLYTILLMLSWQFATQAQI